MVVKIIENVFLREYLGGFVPAYGRLKRQFPGERKLIEVECEELEAPLILKDGEYEFVSPFELWE